MSSFSSGSEKQCEICSPNKRTLNIIKTLEHAWIVIFIFKISERLCLSFYDIKQQKYKISFHIFSSSILKESSWDVTLDTNVIMAIVKHNFIVSLILLWPFTLFLSIKN